MPRKKRDIIRDLERAGYRPLKRRGKGDHRIFRHPEVPDYQPIVDGKVGDDAKPYDEKTVRQALRKLAEAERRK